MTYTPRTQGDTDTPLSQTFQYDDGVTPYPLTGCDETTDFELFLIDEHDQVRHGQGSWQVTNASAGLCLYYWHEDDVAEAGAFYIQARVRKNGNYKTFVRQTLVFEPSPFPPQKRKAMGRFVLQV